MPDRIVRFPYRWFQSHFEGILLTLLCIALVFAIWGWQKAANAQSRVNTLEVKRAAELAAASRTRKTSEVIACFSSARTRPPLVRLLRNINATEPSIQQRRKTNRLITELAEAPVTGIKGKPTRMKCVVQAKKLKVDYRRYDFDPETGLLLHPDDS